MWAIAKTLDESYVFTVCETMVHQYRSEEFNLDGRVWGFQVIADCIRLEVQRLCIQGSFRNEANEVLSTMVACSLGAVEGMKNNHEDLVEAMWMGFNLHKNIVTTPDQMRSAINGILETCPAHSRESSRREFMPFIGDLKGAVQVGEAVR